MEDQENNIPSEQPNTPRRNPKEDIPLWLQGLGEDTEAIHPIPNDNIDDEVLETIETGAGPQPVPSMDSYEPIDSSINEIEDNTEEIEISSKLNPPGSNELPEWINEVVEAPEEPSPEEETQAQQNIPEEDYYSSEEEQTAVSPEITPVLEDDSFIDISAATFETKQKEPGFPERENFAEEDLNSQWKDEDLPDSEDLPTEEIQIQRDNGSDFIEIESLSEKDFETFGAEDTLPDNEASPPEDNEFQPTYEISAAEEDKFMSANEEPHIDEYGFSPENGETPFGENDLLPEDEELPKWLQRLIAESYPDGETDRMYPLIDDTLEEDTRPVHLEISDEPGVDVSDEELSGYEISEELMDFEEIEELEFSDVIPPASENEVYEKAITEDSIDIIGVEEQSGPDGRDETEKELPESMPIQGNAIEELAAIPSSGQLSSSEEEELRGITDIEDTQPIPVKQAGENQAVEWTSEDNLYFNPENGYLIDLPEPLHFAREILKNGEILRALEIFKPYISEGNYLDEIKYWLLEAANVSEENLCEIWSALGDIASGQKDHQEALNAFTKAINYLLKAKDEYGTH